MDLTEALVAPIGLARAVATDGTAPRLQLPHSWCRNSRGRHLLSSLAAALHGEWMYVIKRCNCVTSLAPPFRRAGPAPENDNNPIFERFRWAVKYIERTHERGVFPEWVCPNEEKVGRASSLTPLIRSAGLAESS